MGLQDEKGLAIVTIVMAVFILITLNQTIGVVYLGMAVAYGIYLNQKGRNIEFSRTGSLLNTRAMLFGGLLVVGFVGISSLALGSVEAVVESTVFFTSSFLDNFTIDNPLIRLVVFGVFVPVVETAFFFGVIFPFLIAQTKARLDLTKLPTLIAIVMTGSVATAFHFTVRLLNEQSLFADIIFFTLSAVIVTRQKELSGALYGHLFINTYFMALLLGFI